MAKELDTLTEEQFQAIEVWLESGKTLGDLNTARAQQGLPTINEENYMQARIPPASSEPSEPPLAQQAVEGVQNFGSGLASGLVNNVTGVLNAVTGLDLTENANIINDLAFGPKRGERSLAHSLGQTTAEVAPYVAGGAFGAGKIVGAASKSKAAAGAKGLFTKGKEFAANHPLLSLGGAYVAGKYLSPSDTAGAGIRLFTGGR